MKAASTDLASRHCAELDYAWFHASDQLCMMMVMMMMMKPSKHVLQV